MNSIIPFQHIERETKHFTKVLSNKVYVLAYIWIFDKIFTIIKSYFAYKYNSDFKRILDK